MQTRNNVTRVRVEPRPCDEQGRRKNNAIILSAPLPTTVLDAITAKDGSTVRYVNTVRNASIFA